MKQLLFDLFQSSMIAELGNPKFERILLSLIGALECDELSAERPITRLAISECDVPPRPKDQQHFYSGELQGHGIFEFGRASGGWSMWQPNILSATFDEGHEVCEIYVSPNCPDEKIAMAGAFAVDHAVGFGGQCMIHGACLEVPNSTDRIIVHAKSGTGKTTLALALALSGYKICSDDSAVICKKPNSSASVWGLPRSPRIDPHTKTVLKGVEPFIVSGTANHRGKYTLSRERMQNRGLTADLRPATVLAVIGLSRDYDELCNWRRLDKYDGLISLVEDNIHFGPKGFFPGHERRLDLYSAMLATAVPFELNIGNDVNEAVEAVNQVVQDCQT